MKIFNLFSWIAIVLAGILMICGVIDHLSGGGDQLSGGLFGFKHSSTFFTLANTSLLMALIIKFFMNRTQNTN